MEPVHRPSVIIVALRCGDGFAPRETGQEGIGGIVCNRTIRLACGTQGEALDALIGGVPGFVEWIIGHLAQGISPRLPCLSRALQTDTAAKSSEAPLRQISPRPLPASSKNPRRRTDTAATRHTARSDGMFVSAQSGLRQLRRVRT